MTDTTTALDPTARYATFRQRRDASVAAPQGNLALVLTQWVMRDQTHGHEAAADASGHDVSGQNAGEEIWGVPGRWSALPAGESGLRVTATAADDIRVDGVLVDGEAIVRGKDDPNPGAIVFSDTKTGFVIASAEGDYALRVWDAESEAIQEFGTIDAFPYNPEWVVQAAFVPNDGGVTVGFEHLKDEGKTRELVVPGEIVFEHDGTQYNLAAFKSGRALQLVFADATNGDTTYSVGRFLFVAPNADGSITLDFNNAVLPPCAFSYNFNCPMPPKQNRFPFAIEAGEKNVLNRDGGLLHG